MEPSETDSINLAEFLSVWIYLAEESGKIIREVQESGVLNTEFKTDETDPVTIADFRVQKTILHNIKHLYPNLDIVGEEDPKNYEDLESTVDPSELDIQIKQMIDENMLKEWFEKRKDLLQDSPYSSQVMDDPFQFDTANAQLWLDPLDGTRDFVEGRLENVTCMIGMAINQTAKIAVLHQPFYKEDTSKGITYFGSLETGAFRVPYDSSWSKEELLGREFEYLEPFENDKIDDEETFEPKFTFTWNRFNAQMEDLVSNLEPCTHIKEGGAGNKAISVLTDRADCFVYPKSGMSGWDSCGPEALLKARLGTITDIYGDPFKYQADMGKIKGCIFAKNPNMYALVSKRLKAFVTALKAAI